MKPPVADKSWRTLGSEHVGLIISAAVLCFVVVRVMYVSRTAPVALEVLRHVATTQVGISLLFSMVPSVAMAATIYGFFTPSVRRRHKAALWSIVVVVVLTCTALMMLALVVAIAVLASLMWLRFRDDDSVEEVFSFDPGRTGRRPHPCSPSWRSC
jgi:hypothetical protein